MDLVFQVLLSLHGLVVQVVPEVQQLVLTGGLNLPRKFMKIRKEEIQEKKFLVNL